MAKKRTTKKKPSPAPVQSAARPQAVQAEPLPTGPRADLGAQNATRENRDQQILMEYINTAKRSALPPRMILLFTTLVGVVAFFACWNSRPSGWMSSRVQAINVAIKWYGVPPPGGGATAQDLSEFMMAQEIHRALRPERVEDLKSFAQMLEQARTDYVRTVRIPILGIVFDVNDLGLFSGITLAMSLVLFRFSYDRERANLDLAFRRAERMDSKTGDGRGLFHRAYCYDLLSMSQVAVVPPSRVQREKAPIHWRHATKIGLLIPLLVQSYILYTDRTTYEIGRAINEDAALFVLMANLGALVLIITLIWSSGGIWLELEKLWEKEWDKLLAEAGRMEH